MPIKDLVQQFESSSLGSQGPRTTCVKPHSVLPVGPSLSSRRDPPSSPARFLQHPLLKQKPVPVSPPADTSSPVCLPRHTNATLEGSQVEEHQTVVKQEGSGAETSRSSLPGDTGKPDMSPLQGGSGAEGQGLGITQSAQAKAEQMNGVRGLNGLAGTHAPLSRKLGQISGSSSMVSLADIAKSKRSTVRSVDAPSVSSRDADNSSVSPRPHALGRGICSRRGTAITSHLRKLPASPSNRERRNVQMDTNASTHTDAHSNPPMYVSTPENPSINSSGKSKQPPSFQSHNDIPLDTFARSAHDHDDLMISRPPSPSPTLVSLSPSIPHVPVAAKTVFSRGSAPLSLPALDNYLSSIPAPTFSSFPTGHPLSTQDKPAEGGLSPPMDLLSATGHTIEELEKNSVVRPWWRNRGIFFNAFMNVMIGLMV